MKKSILIVALMFIAAYSQAQNLKESDVPTAVKTSFSKTFPNAKSVKWSKESESEFEAEFRNGTFTQAANFDTSGKWLITETEIRKGDLPQAVQAALKREFDGYKLEEIEKAEMPDNKMFYEIEVEKGKKSYEVQFDVDGKVLKRDEKKESREKD